MVCFSLTFFLFRSPLFYSSLLLFYLFYLPFCVPSINFLTHYLLSYFFSIFSGIWFFTHLLFHFLSLDLSLPFFFLLIISLLSFSPFFISNFSFAPFLSCFPFSPLHFLLPMRKNSLTSHFSFILSSITSNCSRSLSLCFLLLSFSTFHHFPHPLLSLMT